MAAAAGQRPLPESSGSGFWCVTTSRMHASELLADGPETHFVCWGATQLEVVRPAADSVRAITDVLSSVRAITDVPLGVRRLF